MKTHSSYDQDLQRVQKHLRTEVDMYIRSGILPRNQYLLFILNEGPQVRLRRAEWFMLKHCPDTGYGHPAYVKRWAEGGGAEGRGLRL